jgi:hypothetical protein
MPHFGLIEEEKLGPVQSLLMRARLHILGGRLRLQQKKISMGIITLYDALCSALQWYISVPDNVKRLGINTDDLIRDEERIILFLEKAGVLDGTFDFDEFNSLVDRALNEEIKEFNSVSLMSDIEKIMTPLGVMPFDESLLPQAVPDTI